MDYVHDVVALLACQLWEKLCNKYNIKPFISLHNISVAISLSLSSLSFDTHQYKVQRLAKYNKWKETATKRLSKMN